MSVLSSSKERARFDALAASLYGDMPPSFSESFSAAWREGIDFHSSIARDSHLDDIWSERLAEIREKTGEKVINPLQAMPSARAGAFNQARFQLGKISEKHPGVALPSLEQAELDEEAARRAGASRQARQRLEERPRDFAARAGGFVGDIAAGGVDPINLATLPIGAARGVGVLRTAATEALVGAGSQAAIEATTYDFKQQADPTYGTDDVLSNVALTSIAAGGIGGGIAALAKGWRAVRGTREMRDWPREVQDAGEMVEREAILSETNPVRGSARTRPVQPTQNEMFAGQPSSARGGRKGKVKAPAAEQPAAQPPPASEPLVAERPPPSVEAELAHREAVAVVERQIDEGQPVVVPEAARALTSARNSRVFDADNRAVDVRYEVVEADDLITSHADDFTEDPRFPQELQPRDRERAASQEQIQKIASDLQPERLGISASASDGAPVVSADGIVESGNGRTMALRRVYRDMPEQAARYRQYLADQGFDVSDMRQPVLIARRTSDLSPEERVNFTTAANRRQNLQLSDTEQALADARLLDPDLVARLQGGSLSAAGNRDFVAGFLGKLPQAERGGLVGEAGELSAQGQRRIEAALLGRAYADPHLLARILEDTDSDIKAIGGALIDAGGPWARMRDAVARGELAPGMDITDDLLGAIRLVMNARKGLKKGETVASKITLAVDQAAMFGGELSQTGRSLLQAMFRGEGFKRPVGREALAKVLGDYADEALKNTSGARLIGEPLGAGDILGTVTRRPDLLTPAEPAPAAPARPQAPAVSPERAEELMTAPETAQGVEMEMNRLMAEAATGQRPVQKIKIGTKSMTARREGKAKGKPTVADAPGSAEQRILGQPDTKPIKPPDFDAVIAEVAPGHKFVAAPGGWTVAGPDGAIVVRGKGRNVGALREAVEKLRASRQAEAGVAGPGPVERQTLVDQPDGKAMTPRKLQTVLDEVAPGHRVDTMDDTWQVIAPDGRVLGGGDMPTVGEARMIVAEIRGPGGKGAERNPIIEAERAEAERGVLMVPVGERVDETGKLVTDYRSADELMQEADEAEAAAASLEACSLGTPVAESPATAAAPTAKPKRNRIEPKVPPLKIGTKSMAARRETRE